MEQNKEIRHYHHIGSDEELRNSYEFLRKMERSGQIKVLPKLFDDLKQVIREYTHRPPEKSRIVEERGIDGYVELIEFEADSMEGAAAEFDAEYRREYFPTYYDCTGQRFTNWVKFFQRRGRWMAYHSVSVDI
jgi:hypothetical protein